MLAADDAQTVRDMAGRSWPPGTSRSTGDRGRSGADDAGAVGGGEGEGPVTVGVSLSGLRQRRRNIPAVVQHAPDIESIVLFDVEDQIRKPVDSPGPQIRDTEVVGKPERPELRLSGQSAQRALERVHEPRGDIGTRLAEVVVNGALDVVRSDRS